MLKNPLLIRQPLMQVDDSLIDIILKAANGTSYNTYVVRGSQGIVIVDTVKENFADDFFARLGMVTRYDEIQVIVLNHLEPDHIYAVRLLVRFESIIPNVLVQRNRSYSDEIFEAIWINHDTYTCRRTLRHCPTCSLIT